MSCDLRAETREAEGLVRIVATEALTGFFIVPSLAPFSERYPRIRTHLRSPTDLLSFRENQCDVMVGFGPLNSAEIESRPAGFLHLIGTAARSYIESAGLPTWDTLDKHRFIDADYYASQTSTYAPWRDAIGHARVVHQCDNPFAYGLMVKAGMGIGLLANFVMADPDLIPIGLGIHLKLPIYIHALAERLKSRPVRITFDWLGEVFSPKKEIFSPELHLGDVSDDGLVKTVRHLSMGIETRQ
jgi:DNA-binding transcriptional LysR family regulator